MKAADMMEFVDHEHSGEGWVVFHEFRCGTGYGRQNEARIDSLAIGTWRSRGLLRVAYEIKVTRGDFLREAKKPLKQLPALRVSNQFFYLAPPGIIKPDELPPWAGLIEVRRTVQADVPERIVHPQKWINLYQPFKKRVVVPAPERVVEFEQGSFIAALARRVKRTET